LQKRTFDSAILKIISQSVPFKPNFTKIAGMLEASRNNIDDYYYFMEQAGLIMQLRNMGEGIGQLGKIDKVYMDNTKSIISLLRLAEKAKIKNR